MKKWATSMEDLVLDPTGLYQIILRFSCLIYDAQIIS